MSMDNLHLNSETVKFLACERPGRCPRREPGAQPPADLTKLCWYCQDWWRWQALDAERRRKDFADRERLAPLLRDLSRLVEVFPVECFEALRPLLDTYVLKRHRLFMLHMQRRLEKMCARLLARKERHG